MASFSARQSSAKSKYGLNLQANKGIVSARFINALKTSVGTTTTAKTLTATTIEDTDGVGTFKVNIQNGGVDTSSSATLDFIGNGITVADGGSSVATITKSPVVDIEEGGVSVGTFSTINVDGSLVVSATDAPSSTIDITSNTENLNTVLTNGNDANDLDIDNHGTITFETATSKGVRIGVSGNSASTNRATCIAIGGGSYVGGILSVGIGSGSDISYATHNSVNIGKNSSSYAAGSSIGLGNDSRCRQGSIALGKDTISTSNVGIAIGLSADAPGPSTNAIGTNARCLNYDFAIGYSAYDKRQGGCIGKNAYSYQSFGFGEETSTTTDQLQFKLTSGVGLAASSGSLTTSLTLGAAPATAPTSGAATAVPANPDTWLANTFNGTAYLTPLWTGDL